MFNNDRLWLECRYNMLADIKLQGNPLLHVKHVPPVLSKNCFHPWITFNMFPHHTIHVSLITICTKWLSLS